MRDFIYFLTKSAGKRGPIVVLLQLISSLTEGISILLLIPILSLASRSTDGDYSIVVPEDVWLINGAEFGLLEVLACLIGIVLFQAALSVFRNYFLANTMLTIMNDFRLSIVASILNSSWRHYSHHTRADLNHMLTGDIDRVNSVAAAIINLIQMSLMFTVYCILSFLVSPTMTLFAGALGLVTFIILKPVRKGTALLGSSLTEYRQQQYRMVADLLNGMKTTKSFNSEQILTDGISKNLEEQKQNNLRLNRLSSRVTASYQILSAIALVSFVYIALVYNDISLPKLVVLLLIFMRLAPRFLSFQTTLQLALSNLPAYQNMQQLKAGFDGAKELDYTENCDIPRSHKQIELQNVAYSHPNQQAGQNVLSNINMVIKHGEIAALIGPSGAGKSTLAEIILGLLQPTQGRLLVDGSSLSPAQLRAWRKHVAYVPQDVFLMNDSLAANMRLGKTDATDTEIWNALEMAQAAEFVKNLPQQIDQAVGDGGHQLSGGELQRISLARALLRMPQVLVLDEPTSALDWENQQKISDVVESLKGSVTVLIISHHASMVAFADQIFAIEKGQIQESGSLDKLASNSSSILSSMLNAKST